MKLSAIFCLGLSLLLMACESNLNNGNFNEPTTGQDFNVSPSQQQVPELKASSKNENVFQENLNNSAVRDIWQDPLLVLQKLGDLSGKVVADIGAGEGYFTFLIAHRYDVKKVIAIDIDQEKIQFIENAKIVMKDEVSDRIEARLVQPHDPNLQSEEADVVLIVNTYTYFDNPLEYLKNVKTGISKDGVILIVDFKKRNTPVGPSLSSRSAIGKVEQDLMKAGYVDINSDDQTLDFQYIIMARPGIEQ